MLFRLVGHFLSLSFFSLSHPLTYTDITSLSTRLLNPSPRLKATSPNHKPNMHGRLRLDNKVRQPIVHLEGYRVISLARPPARLIYIPLKRAYHMSPDRTRRRCASSPVQARKSTAYHYCVSLTTVAAILTTRSRHHSGIGLETALQFAAEGAHLVLSDINLQAVQGAADLINSRYHKAHAIAVRCDVSKEAEVKAVVERAVDHFGRLDVMVSWASLFMPIKTRWDRASVCA